MERLPNLDVLDNQKGMTAACDCCGSFLMLCNQDEGFCHFCESYLLMGEDEPNNPEVDKFAAIQLLIDQKDVEGAEKRLDKITSGMENQSNPYLLFGAANMYRALADIKYFDLDYHTAGRGFMEGNSSNIYHSLDLTTKYKEMFYKAIKLAENQTKTGMDEGLLYLIFISYMKLKRPLDAAKALTSLKHARRSLAKEYMELINAVESGREEGKQDAINMMSKGNPNAVYYLARHYVKQKKLAEAKYLLEKLNSKVRMPDSLYMLHKIDRVLEETRL